MNPLDYINPNRYTFAGIVIGVVAVAIVRVFVFHA